MINVPMNVTAPFQQQTVLSINERKVQAPVSIDTVQTLNRITQGANFDSPSRTTHETVSHTQAQDTPFQSAQPSFSRASASAGSYSQTQSTQAQQSSFFSQPNTQNTQAQPSFSRASASAGSYSQPQTAQAQQGNFFSQPKTQPAQAQAPFSRATASASSHAQTTAPTLSAGRLPASRPQPTLLHEIQKGQKVSLSIGNNDRVDVCLGWNVLHPDCDADVSAFLLDASGKVLGDSWFVFYGQTKSPDQSTVFHIDSGTDREIISIDFAKLNPAVSKILFVLTINEALEKNLNFSMMKDAYIRILNPADQSELVSFSIMDYYSNASSMMIGELYLHNENWKFNAIGNGVSQDLAGLCERYGVQIG